MSSNNPRKYNSDTVHADERRFLDDRGSSGPLAPNGLNPATIMEKAVRERIVDSYFWKEQCFAMNEADVVDRVVEHVRFVGGTFGATQKPSPFLCLAFKLLQLAPRDDVLRAYLGHGGDRFKYLRALAAFYVRLTRKAEDVYRTLEPYLEDRRKLRRKGRARTTMTYVDEFVDELLVKERVCATSLWKMPKREQLEDLDVLEPRVSPLGDIEDILEEEGEDSQDKDDEEEDDQEKGDQEKDDQEKDDQEKDDQEKDDQEKDDQEKEDADEEKEEGEQDEDDNDDDNARGEAGKQSSRDRDDSGSDRGHDRDDWSDQSGGARRPRSSSRSRSPAGQKQD